MKRIFGICVLIGLFCGCEIQQEGDVHEEITSDGDVTIITLTDADGNSITVDSYTNSIPE